jgi:hypothetical protein
MNKNKRDHERGRPAVNRPDNPAQRNLSHYSSHACIGPFKRGIVVKNKQEACNNLNNEKKQYSASGVVPHGMPMLGNFFVPQEVKNCG